MGPFWELVLYCILWMILQAIICVVIHYYAMTYKYFCYSPVYKNSKFICYFFGAVGAGVTGAAAGATGAVVQKMMS